MITAYKPTAKLIELVAYDIDPTDLLIFKLEDRINEHHNPYWIETWVLRNGLLLHAGYRNTAYPDAYCGKATEVDFDRYPKEPHTETLIVLEQRDRKARLRCSQVVDYRASGTRVRRQCVRPATGSNGHCKHHTPK